MEEPTTARKTWMSSRTGELCPTDHSASYVIRVNLDEYLSFLCLKKSFTASRSTLSKNTVIFVFLSPPHYSRISNPRVLCYPGELNQVWTNLIHNALQAMDYKGILTITSRTQNGQVIISITDTGKGIPDEIKEKIFDPFFTTKRTGKGSGLGLDIVKKIVDKHQGRIHVESQPGNTTFRVVLPIRERE
jgi:signal transduction histidine kinase